METQNVTLPIRRKALHRAKLVVVKRGTSLSKLMPDALEAIAGEEGDYEQARHRQLPPVRRGLDLGTYGRPVASRDELQERWGRLSLRRYHHPGPPYDAWAGAKHDCARGSVARLWHQRIARLSAQALREFYVTVTCRLARPLGLVLDPRLGGA